VKKKGTSSGRGSDNFPKKKKWKRAFWGRAAALSLQSKRWVLFLWGGKSDGAKGKKQPVEYTSLKPGKGKEKVGGGI